MRCHSITLRPSKIGPSKSVGHSSSRMVCSGAPPRTGSYTSDSGLDFATEARASRKQLPDLKYPWDTKIMITCERHISCTYEMVGFCESLSPSNLTPRTACEPSIYSSRASIDSRSSTSRKMETPGMSRESWRLMVAHWSCPVPHMLRAQNSTRMQSCQEGVVLKETKVTMREARQTIRVAWMRALAEKKLPGDSVSGSQGWAPLITFQLDDGRL